MHRMNNFCDSVHSWLLDQRWRSIWQTTLQYRLRDENEQTSDFKTSLPFTMSNILFLFLFFACRVNVSIVNTQCLLYMNALHFFSCLCLERPKQPNSLPYTLILLVYLYIDLFKAVILCCTWGHFITADIRWHFNYISLSRQIVKIEP